MLRSAFIRVTGRIAICRTGHIDPRRRRRERVPVLRQQAIRGGTQLLAARDDAQGGSETPVRLRDLVEGAIEKKAWHPGSSLNCVDGGDVVRVDCSVVDIDVRLQLEQVGVRGRIIDFGKLIDRHGSAIWRWKELERLSFRHAIPSHEQLRRQGVEQHFGRRAGGRQPHDTRREHHLAAGVVGESRLSQRRCREYQTHCPDADKPFHGFDTTTSIRISRDLPYANGSDHTYLSLEYGFSRFSSHPPAAAPIESTDDAIVAADANDLPAQPKPAERERRLPFDSLRSLRAFDSADTDNGLP